MAMIKINERIKNKITTVHDRIKKNLLDLNQETLSEEKKKEKIQSIDWTMDIENFLVPSTTKIGNTRVYNPHHFKRLSIYAALAAVPNPNSWDNNAYRALLECESQTNEAVEELKKTGGEKTSYFVSDGKIISKPQQTEQGLLNESYFLDSKHDVLPNNTLIASLKEQIKPYTRNTDYEDTLVAKALSYFLYSTAEASFDPSSMIQGKSQKPFIFYKPYRGKALYKDSIVRAWKEFFKEIRLSLTGSVEEDYREIEKMVGTAFYLNQSQNLTELAA
jgi:hypothetical protein